MSAFIDAPFGELAPFLWDYGYQPVPIKPGGKAPMLPDWQCGHPPDHWLPRCHAWGTGVLAANCPAIDIDVADRALVRALVDLAARTLLAMPFRIGRPPKVLLPFATEEPFDKVASRWFALPGDDWRRDGYQPHRVEILGRGQQFVAYATHPGTGRPYRWGRGEPMQIHRDDLPELTEKGARAYVAAAEGVLLGAGGVPLRKAAGLWAPHLGHTEQPTSKRTARRWNDEGSDWRSLSAEAVARTIDPRGAHRTRNGWSCQCPAHRGAGHTSLGITEGRDGRLVVHCFAECAFAEIAAAIEAVLGRRAAA